MRIGAIDPRIINPCARRKVVNFTSLPLYSSREGSRNVLGLFLISTRTPHPPPSVWLRLFSSQTFSSLNTPTVSFRLFFLLTPPMKMERTVCSETSAYTFQKPGNHPKEIIQRAGFSFHTFLIFPFFYRNRSHVP
jgi:hypothetical protein